MNVLLRTTASPAALAEPLARLVSEIDASVPIAKAARARRVFSESIGRPRLLAQLLGAFAALAVLLAAVGTYGVLTYLVASRRREIGVRMALGADRAGVVALVMKPGIALTSAGIAIGVGAATMISRLVASFLFDVQPRDPATTIVVIVTMAVVAIIACGVPALRAASTDPMAVLRTD